MARVGEVVGAEGVVRSRDAEKKVGFVLRGRARGRRGSGWWNWDILGLFGTFAVGGAGGKMLWELCFAGESGCKG